MSPQHPSRAVRGGHRLLTLMLAAALLFAAFAIVSVVVGLARDGDSLLYGERLTVPLQLNPQDVGSLPPNVHFVGWPDVSVEVRDPTANQMFLRSAMDFGPLALFVAGLWLLRGFAGAVRAGDPFGAGNVTRLRRLGFILVIGAPIVELLNSALRGNLYDILPPQSADVGVAGFTLPGYALLGGLGAFILAEVFAYGVRLREEVEGTV
jgi:hypothetical protein